ncbi:hypothetical protein [Cystobacter fuscus]
MSQQEKGTPGERWSRALETLFREREPALPAFLCAMWTSRA